MTSQRGGRLRCLILGGAGVLLAWGIVLADDETERFWIPESIGIRGAFPADTKAEGFYQLDAYSRWKLPWDFHGGENWTLRTWGDISAGYLTDDNQEGFVGTVGPSFTIERAGFPVVFEMGSSPTFLSRHRFDEGDFGYWFQFTSHAGFRWYIDDHFTLAYRLQHMSNAGIKERNPGLDLHAFMLGYRF